MLYRGGVQSFVAPYDGWLTAKEPIAVKIGDTAVDLGASPVEVAQGVRVSWTVPEGLHRNDYGPYYHFERPNAALSG